MTVAALSETFLSRQSVDASRRSANSAAKTSLNIAKSSAPSASENAEAGPLSLRSLPIGFRGGLCARAQACDVIGLFRTRKDLLDPSAPGIERVPNFRAVAIAVVHRRDVALLVVEDLRDHQPADPGRCHAGRRGSA